MEFEIGGKVIMRRKGLGVVLSMVLALALGVTSMAAPSKEVNGIVTKVEMTDASGNDVSISVKELPKKYENASKQLNDKNTIKKVLGSEYKSSYKVWDVVDLKKNSDGDVEYPATVRVAVKGVTEGSDLIVLQWDGSEWVVVESTVEDGYVEFEVDGIAPVAFVADMKTVSKTSPTTGDVAPIAVMVVMAAAVGAVALGRKEFAR